LKKEELLEMQKNTILESLNKTSLYYDQPTENWMEAMPLGNGHIGAMVFGNTPIEHIQINDETLYAGQKLDDNPPEALKYLPEVRKLLLEGRNIDAFELAEKYLLGTPPRVRSYQSLGDIYLDLGHRGEIEDYRRVLDMEKGTVSVSYKSEGVQFAHNYFVSAPEDVLVAHITADKPGKVSAAITMTREQDAVLSVDCDDLMILKGQIIDKSVEERGPGGSNMRFEAHLSIRNTGGVRIAGADSITVKDAESLLLILNSTTDYDIRHMDFDRNKTLESTCEAVLKKAALKDYETLKKEHYLEHSQLFNRVSIDIGGDIENNGEVKGRLEEVRKGFEDKLLIEQMFNFGRYLLIGSSRRPGVLPANLQGIWAEGMECPWNADFHTNINLQMNYWPAEICNLSETVEPLVDFIDGIKISGRKTSEKMYGAKGWTVHHLTDVFGKTAVHDGIKQGMFPMGGPWMSLHLWDHYEFNENYEFLYERAYPIMKESAQFVLDFLIEDNKGQLVTAPSYSPENWFRLPDGNKTRITYGPTMDIEIIHELFIKCIAAAEILQIDKDFRDELYSALRQLPPIQINKNGTIQEWVEDYEEVEIGHRHVSHLFGLYPGEMITSKTPKLFEAAKRTLERRLSNGGAGTGWSRAWTINFFARFREGDIACEHVQALLSKSTANNLFDMHPPFQIDGNFGFTAGIAEMLLQSHEGHPGNRIIEILPALPKAWTQGNVRGLKARGNFEVDIYWSNMKAEKVIIKSISGKVCRVSYNLINEARIVTESGHKVDYRCLDRNSIEFDTVKGEVYYITL
jgi:alpha-L-fucosidase 2